MNATSSTRDPQFPALPRSVTEFARRVVLATDLAAKLAPAPSGLEDAARGPAERPLAPGRPADLVIASGRSVRVPPPSGMADPAQRVRILHALANHELQAAELFAWALLAFPGAPDAFRRGCLAVLHDEQRHCALYIARLEELGGRFGEHAVNGHFWRHLDRVRTPLAFACTVGLTFENANLDFAQELAAAARAAGDTETARVLDEVHTDEIRHVAFGWQWLQRLKDPASNDWDVYLAEVPEPHGPTRARGRDFDGDARRAAGLSEEFVERLAQTAPERPGGAAR